MNEMLRYTIIRVILFVMGGFLLLGCSDEDDVDNSGGTILSVGMCATSA